MTDKQPEALRLADELEYNPRSLRDIAIATVLCRLHKENERLKAERDELNEALVERDEAEDYIDILLDEVLGTDRAEWSNAYGRADALEEVRERIAALAEPVQEPKPVEETLCPVWDTGPTNKDIKDAMRMQRLNQIISPQRKWVGLTDEEVDEWTPEIHTVIRAIEAKLKEKNT